MTERYNDGLDEPTAPRVPKPGARRLAEPIKRVQTERDTETRTEKAKPKQPLSKTFSENVLMRIQWITVPLFAALVFGVLAVLAAGSVEFALRDFAEEAGINSLIFVAVPGLFAVLYALLVYQNADTRITTINQSVSRGILVTLLTWISFSMLATWAWSSPENYSSYFANVLIVSGIIGGGPMLIAGLISGWLVGWLITNRRLGWIMD